MTRLLSRTTPALISSVLSLAVAACSSGETSIGDAPEDEAGTAVAPLPRPQAPAPRSEPTEQMNYVPGEFIVKFKSESSTAVMEDVSRTLRERRSFAKITADGSDSLDSILRRHGVKQATSLLLDREGLSTSAAKLRLRNTVQRSWQRRALRTTAPMPTQNLSPIEGMVNVYRLRLAAGADLDEVMADLRKDPHVEWVHPNYVASLSYAPNDPYFSSSNSWGQGHDDLWNLKKINAPRAWDSTRGNGVVVAVIDTGVDIQHPDLLGNLWKNPDEFPVNGDVNGCAFEIEGISCDDVSDDVGHGTHVAGIIAAQDNNGKGIVGVAPDAKVMPVRALTRTTPADVFAFARALMYAIRNGADVINNSWSACPQGCPSVEVIEQQVRAAHAAGVVVVFAAGNEKDDIHYSPPLNMPESIVVASTDFSDALAETSNYGLVDLAAPGVDVLSTRTKVEGCSYCGPRNVGDAYLLASGTSMAAPHVAGAAALVLSLHPEYSPEQVRQVLRRTSFDVNGGGYDLKFGYGRLDVGRIASEPTPLEALIQAPTNARSTLLTINGSANGSQFANYVLEYGRGISPSTWIGINSSTTPVRNGALGFWKPATLPDGDYTFRLRATKTNGAVYEDRHRTTLDRIYITAPTPMGFVRGGDFAITGSAAPGDFRSYALRVQNLETGAPVSANITLTSNGTSPVFEGTLGVWRTQGLAAGHYRLLLDVTTTTGSIITESVAVVMDPLLHVGFPVDLTHPRTFESGPSGGMTVADLQGDGKAEIIAGWSELVTVLRADGSPLPGWPKALATATATAPQQPFAPIAGDIDGDGRMEVVAVADNTVFVLSDGGVAKPGWPRRINGSGAIRISLADVDRNGVVDVVATESDQGVFAFSGNGKLLPGWPALIGAGIVTPATVADLNLDGRNEVVVSVDGAPSRLYVLSATGVVQSGWPRALANVGGNASSGGYPVVGDVDDDGDLEIVTVASNGETLNASLVAIYHHNGQLLRSWSPNARRVGAPVLADVDGDGSLEIVSSILKADWVGALHVWDRNGSALPGWPQSNLPLGNADSTPFTTPIVADLDGDGRAEVIVSRPIEYYSEDLQHTFGYPVRAYRYNGVSATNLIRPAYGAAPRTDASLAVADIDGDAKLELLWTEGRPGEPEGSTVPRVWSWDLSAASSAAQPWPSYRGDARNSGVARSVVPLARLTQRNTTLRVSGLSRFIIRSGGSGVMQVKHASGASVQYAIGNNLLKTTALGWGEQFNVPPNQDVKLRVVTTAPTDVTIDWW